MTVEERHEALLDDLRKHLHFNETIAEACRKRITDNTPEDDYSRLKLWEAEGNIAFYKTLLKDDWERQFDLKRD